MIDEGRKLALEIAIQMGPNDSGVLLQWAREIEAYLTLADQKASLKVVGGA